MTEKSVPKNFKVTELIASEADRLVVAFRQKLVGHAAEFGRAREEIVRDFLRQQLPEQYGVATGFVFDIHGTVSHQLDIVVYDKQACPVFTTAGGVFYFPCEGVLCVGQVKSSIKSKSEYQKALSNLHSVKSLDRSGGGINFARKTGEPIDQQNNHLDQIFTFVFVIDRCLAESALRKVLFEYLWNNERPHWPNITYVFDKFITTLGCQGGICPNPMDAFGISVVKEVPNSELLLWFSRLVTQAVAITHVASFSYHGYLHGSKPRPWTLYTFRDAPVRSKLPRHLTEVPVADWWQPNTTK